jgi:ApaG protein
MPSIATSSDIEVKAASIYLDDYSVPANNNFLFCYKIEIQNKSPVEVQLLNRYWLIIDSDSDKSEVSGEGVVGKKPTIAPGETHVYFSFSNLKTNFGTMEGSYGFIDQEGNSFNVEIPRYNQSKKLNELPKNRINKGQILKHQEENYYGLVVDFDMYFLSNADLDTTKFDKSFENKPWYYVLVHDTDLMLYVPEDLMLSVEGDFSIKHPLVEVFFDKKNGHYLRKANSDE